jgi:16S rRNA (guanine527-N7)-methyltransferase
VSSAQLELEALLEEAGIETGLRHRLAGYGARVHEMNRRFNLTGAKTLPDVAFQLLDSLTVAPYVRDPYIDVGSGAGFPAIPVAMASGVAVTMIEATAKKARFLRETIAALTLPGEILAERAEVAAHHAEWRERFASGTARALASAPTVAELLLPFIAIGGAAVLQRGNVSDEERRSLEDAALMLGGEVEAEHELEAGRRILVVRKRRATPERFPRRIGLPEKRPLCSRRECSS